MKDPEVSNQLFWKACFFDSYSAPLMHTNLLRWNLSSFSHSSTLYNVSMKVVNSEVLSAKRYRFSCEWHIAECNQTLKVLVMIILTASIFFQRSLVSLILFLLQDSDNCIPEHKASRHLEQFTPAVCSRIEHPREKSTYCATLEVFSTEAFRDKVMRKFWHRYTLQSTWSIQIITLIKQVTSTTSQIVIKCC